MKKIASILISLLFFASAIDALQLASHWTGDLKCPRCKMKMQKADDCRCHKKKPPQTTIIHDPCADEEGDFTIHFDRLSAVLSPITHFVPVYTAILPVPTYSRLVGTFADIPYPPPRI